jgi:Protein of unknown function (DUF3048) C-terminal domain/Protein of unknown function (DUF3048) N-terminal domain
MTQVSRRAALAGILGLGLAGCTRIQPAGAPSTAPTTPPVSPTPDPAPSPAPTPTFDSRPRWPLTGTLVKGESKLRHPAVAVKVADNRQEHPQRGIDEADIVFVELEGYRDPSGYSGTRLVPVFHSRMPKTVEPVRSIRPVDVPLLAPMNALIGNTGAAPWVTNYVKHHRDHLEGMLSYMNTRGTGSYGTDWSRVYTLNGQRYYDRATTCHPAVLAKQTERFRAGPPRPYFPFATGTAAVSAAAGKPGRSVRVPYKGEDYFMAYRYVSATKRYVRSMPWGPHVMADGTRISTDNVLVIKAKQHYGKIFAGSGHDEPLQDIIETSGRFYYFNRGRYVTGTWRKDAVEDPFEFVLADGSPLLMAPGRTFVELPDTAARIRIKA